MGNYQIKYAAGRYWISKPHQTGTEYRRPFVVNESGARIFQMLADGLTEEAVVREISQEFQLAEDVVKPDIADFMRHIQQYLFPAPGA